jgi:hypothetical protein
MNVTKVIEGDGVYEDFEVLQSEGITVQYTITIKAVEDLQNIRISDVCTVSNAHGGGVCPSTNPDPLPSLPIEPGTSITLAAGESYTFSYSRNFIGEDYTASRIRDSFTVTADTANQTNTQETAIASFIVGNPPSDCPEGWPI